jgi:signal transduction histidine kinase
MLETINATVSHEMRNPINAILCQNIAFEEITTNLENLLAIDDISKLKDSLRNLIV